MDYLLSSGKKFCAVKILTRTGRVRVGQGRHGSFPKSIGFRSPKRPIPPNQYQVRLRGVGVADIKIKEVYAVDARDRFFHVEADFVPAHGRFGPNAHKD